MSLLLPILSVTNKLKCHFVFYLLFCSVFFSVKGNNVVLATSAFSFAEAAGGSGIVVIVVWVGSEVDLGEIR